LIVLFQSGSFSLAISWHRLDFMQHSWSARRFKFDQNSCPTLIDGLPRFKVRMSKNGEFVEEGSGKNSLKSPALCLAELGAAIERRFPSEPLGAGEIVSSGTLTAGHLTGRGDVWDGGSRGAVFASLRLHLT